MNERVAREIQRQKSRKRWAVSAASACCNLFMMLAVIGASLYGTYLLWEKGLGDKRFRMDGETLALAGSIRQCPESIGELESIGRRFNGRSLLDPRLVSDMKTAYGESRWIRKITRLRRKFPNRMEIEFLLRMPAAQVWHDNEYWMIDDEAALLPVAASERRFAELPEIVGVTPDIIRNRPKTGDHWLDEGVTGALGILRSFWGSPLGEVIPIDRVVVNAGAYRDPSGDMRSTRRRFEVVSITGAVVRWGTFNPGDLDGELTSPEKLWLLQELLRSNEARRPGVCFDVRTRLPGYTIMPDEL